MFHTLFGKQWIFVVEGWEIYGVMTSRHGKLYHKSDHEIDTAGWRELKRGFFDGAEGVMDKYVRHSDLPDEFDVDGFLSGMEL